MENWRWNGNERVNFMGQGKAFQKECYLRGDLKDELVWWREGLRDPEQVVCSKVQYCPHHWGLKPTLQHLCPIQWPLGKPVCLCIQLYYDTQQAHCWHFTEDF